MTNFGRVPEDEWRIGTNVELGRKQRLLETDFGTITDEVSRQLHLAYFKRERLREHSEAFRVVLTVCLPAKVVDELHNGAGGYRAQFYLGVSQGERANRHLIDRMLPVLQSACRDEHKRGCPWSFVEASLSGTDAKVWIHQGDWLRRKRHSDRNLMTPRWLQNSESMNLRCGKIGVWAQLTPAQETRVVLKGGAVDHGNQSLGIVLKPSRSQELYDFGFT